MNDLLDLDLSATSSAPQQPSAPLTRGPQAKYGATRSTFDYLSSMGSSTPTYSSSSRSNSPLTSSTGATIRAAPLQRQPSPAATSKPSTNISSSDAFSSLFESASSANGSSNGSGSQSMAARLTGPTAGSALSSASRTGALSPSNVGSRPSSAASSGITTGASNGQAANGVDAWNFDLLANKQSTSAALPPPKPQATVANLASRMSKGALDVDDDDDDPFDMGSSLLPSSSRTRAPPSINTTSAQNDDDFDLLGAFSRPVEKPAAREPQFDMTSSVTRSQRRQSPSPPPHVLGQIVEIGFSIPQARTALAATATVDGSWDVQAALEALMDQNQAESSTARRREEDEMGRRAAERLQAAEEQEQPRRPRKLYQDEENEFREDPVLRQRPEHNGRHPPRRQDGGDANGADVQARVQEQANELLAQASKFGLSMFKSGKAYWESSKASIQKALDEANNASGEAPQDRTSKGVDRQPNGRPKWWTDETATGKEEGNQALSRDAQRSAPDTSKRRQQSTSAPPTSFRDSDDEDAGFSAPTHAAETRSTPAPTQRPAAPPTSDLLGSGQSTQGEPSGYKSPWRRAKAADTLHPSAASSAVPSRSSTPRRSPSPAPITRTPVSVSPSQLACATSHKEQGNEMFKLGRFGDAVASYSSAISALPSGSLVLVPLYNNRAAARLKNGEERAAAEDCTEAVTIILGGSELERVDLGKALIKRAKGFEATEKWTKASEDYAALLRGGEPLLKAAGGIKIVNEGVARCRQMTGQGPAPAATPRLATRPTGSRTKPVAAAIASRPVVNELEKLRKRCVSNAAAEAEDDLRLQLKDNVDAKILAWKGGKESNLRALIASLDSVVWPELGWKTVGMNELLSEGQLKGQYVRAIAKLHPDKLNATNTTVEQRMIAGQVFGALNDAWNSIKT
ncbi:hypothetical protein ACM66B_002744 [Microbotryomycetes sp. NB124-2]